MSYILPLIGMCMETKSNSEYYKNKLSSGLEYQDFVAEELYKLGLPIFNYSSKKYQIKYGENKLGVEIKHNEMFDSTGNLWIETKEKSNPDNPYYVDAGIYRNDNSWLYITGTRKVIYVFSKKFLRQLLECKKYTLIENNRKSSWGYLMPRSDADMYCIRKLEFK